MSCFVCYVCFLSYESGLFIWLMFIFSKVVIKKNQYKEQRSRLLWAFFCLAVQIPYKRWSSNNKYLASAVQALVQKKATNLFLTYYQSNNSIVLLFFSGSSKSANGRTTNDFLSLATIILEEYKVKHRLGMVIL